jgi:cyclomaltodextrinase
LVKSINSEAYLTAELVDPIEKTKPYLSGDEFDATMNYNFSFLVHDFFVQDAKGISVTQFDTQLKELREGFGEGVAMNMQNLVGSHDATRIGSAVANPDGKKFSDWGAYFNWSQKSNNTNYIARKPTVQQLKKQKLIAAFQILYLGSPMIYYGDEAGMWGGNDPDCRKPMVWNDKKYNQEIFNPDQSKHEADVVNFDTDLFNWYKKIISLRNQYKAIKVGNYTTIATNDAEKIYAFSRKLGDEEVIVIINRSDKNVNFTNPILKKGKYKDVFTKKGIKKLTIKPMDIVVLSNSIR